MGLITALTNPKVGLFYIALLPQFVPEGTPVLPATLLLAGIQIWLELRVVLRPRLGRGTRPRRVLGAPPQIQAATGALMVGFGLTILADQR